MGRELTDIPSHELVSALYDRLCFERCRMGDSGDEIMENARRNAVNMINNIHEHNVRNQAQ